MTLLLDTGAVYAYYDRSDSWHKPVRSTIDAATGTLALPAVVIAEVDHLLGARLGHAAQLAFYDDLVEHVYHVVDLAPAGYPRIRELNRRHADLRLGFVDAAVAVVAEQLDLRSIVTTDRRHFPAIAADVPLELLPH